MNINCTEIQSVHGVFDSHLRYVGNRDILPRIFVYCPLTLNAPSLLSMILYFLRENRFLKRMIKSVINNLSLFSRNCVILFRHRAQICVVT